MSVSIAVAGSPGYGPQAQQVLAGLVSSLTRSLQAASRHVSTQGEVATVPVGTPTLPPDNPFRQLPPPAGAARIVVREPVYAGQPFTVDFSGLPGQDQNEWISVELAGSKPWSYQQYHYTKGQRSGSLQFNGLAKGTWEMRLYHSSNDTTIRASTTFTIR